MYRRVVTNLCGHSVFQRVLPAVSRLRVHAALQTSIGLDLFYIMHPSNHQSVWEK